MSAQERLIPARVKSAFLNMYPHVQNERWEKFTKDYTAHFSQEGKTIRTTFTENGEWTQAIIESSLQQLPSSVYSAFQKTSYKEYRVLHVNIVSSVKDLLLYEIELEGNFKEHIRLSFNNTGEMVTVKRGR